MVIPKDGFCNVCGAPCRIGRRLCVACKHWYELCRAAVNFKRRVREEVRTIHKRSRDLGYWIAS